MRGRVWRKGELVDEDFDFARISDHLADADSLTWVDICDPDHARIQALAGELTLDPNAVEDAISTGERAKATRYATHTFLTVYTVELRADSVITGAAGSLKTQKISAFVFPHV